MNQMSRWTTCLEEKLPAVLWGESCNITKGVLFKTLQKKRYSELQKSPRIRGGCLKCNGAHWQRKCSKAAKEEKRTLKFQREFLLILVRPPDGYYQKHENRETSYKRENRGYHGGQCKGPSFMGLGSRCFPNPSENCHGIIRFTSAHSLNKLQKPYVPGAFGGAYITITQTTCVDIPFPLHARKLLLKKVTISMVHSKGLDKTIIRRLLLETTKNGMWRRWCEGFVRGNCGNRQNPKHRYHPGHGQDGRCGQGRIEIQGGERPWGNRW